MWCAIGRAEPVGPQPRVRFAAPDRCGTANHFIDELDVRLPAWRGNDAKSIDVQIVESASGFCCSKEAGKRRCAP